MTKGRIVAVGLCFLGAVTGGCGASSSDPTGVVAGGGSDSAVGGASTAGGAGVVIGHAGTSSSAGSGGQGGSTAGAGGMLNAAGNSGGPVGAAGDSGAKPNVRGTPECDAYCKKLALCPEATCDTYSCLIRDGSCAAETRALLQCAIDTGKWTCFGGGGYAVNDQCVRMPQLCK